MKQHRRRDWYRIQNAAKSNEATVYIYDVIDSFWGVNAQDLVKELASLDVDTIHLRINSPGGNVFDGMAIYNALDRHKAEIITHVDGIAASAASVIALAGDKVLMGAGSFFMIHNAWGIVIGDANDMRQMAGTLEKINDSIVKIYSQQTEASEKEIRAWMDEETWFDADEAIDAGFADEEEDSASASARAELSAAGCEMLSKFKHTPKGVSDPLSSPDTRAELTPRDAERALRDAGFSNKAAKGIVAGGYKATPEPRDEDEEADVLAGVDQLIATLHI